MKDHYIIVIAPGELPRAIGPCRAPGALNNAQHAALLDAGEEQFLCKAELDRGSGELHFTDIDPCPPPAA